MAWNEEAYAEHLSQKARETSSKLRAAGIAGIKSFVSTQPTGPGGVRFEFGLRAPDSSRPNSSLNQAPAPDSTPPSPAPQKSWTTNKPVTAGSRSPWQDSGDTIITSQSTPLKKDRSTSLWPSHHSLWPDIASPVKQEPVPLSHAPSGPSSSGHSSILPSSLKSQPLPNPNKGRNLAENLGLTSFSGRPLDKLSDRAWFNASPTRTSRSTIRDREDPRKSLLRKLVSVFLVLASVVLVYCAIILFCDMQIESLLIYRHGGGDVKPWMKIFNEGILKELDLVDRFS